MKYFNSHFNSLNDNGEYALVIGAAGGRVNFYPMAKWLYSLRFFILWYKLEILWTTGEGYACEECEAISLHANDSTFLEETQFIEGSKQGSSRGIH